MVFQYIEHQETHLAMQRRMIGYTQRLLAEKSGVNIRLIQQYESKARDINKAAAGTLWLLSKALQCRIEDIIDIEVDTVTDCIVNRKTKETLDTGYEEIKRIITPAEAKNDLAHGWKFNWYDIQKQGYTIIELFTLSDNKLQGRIAFQRKEMYYYIGYVENAPKNVGAEGIYEGIGGNLFAIVCAKSKSEGFDGVVSFITKKDPKVIANYTEKLHAKQIGTSQLMVLDETAADYLISKYGLEEEDEQ